VLVNERNEICGGLGFNDDGAPTVILTDHPTLKARAELTLTKSGPALVLADAKGVHRITLSVKAGANGLMLRDRRGRPRAIIALDDRGRTQVRLSDQRGAELTLGQAPTRHPRRKEAQR
jgi:hypothetical protein